MQTFTVTRAHLRAACAQQQWDLLDKLLELDRTHIDDAALFTDAWGAWWGLLFDAVAQNAPDGVRVLLKHGACRDVATWGDCEPVSVLELAYARPAILALLESDAAPTYERATDPPLPTGASAEDQAVHRQGALRDATGLVFPLPPIKPE